MKIVKTLKKQRGAISILGAASIALSLYGFQQVLEYGNAKILDRELDNYARTAAGVALRSELALTKAGIDAGSMDVSQTDLTINDLLAQVEMVATSDEPDDINLKKEITFGKFKADGTFESCVDYSTNPCSDASNPRNVGEGEVPAEFSAVAVQFWSTESFYTFTPQGRALYGMSKENTDLDTGCYCKNRYNACLSADLTEAELSPMPNASAVAVTPSEARTNYCNVGYTESKDGNAGATKYPWSPFDDGWIGRVPNTVNLFNFYTQGYSDAAFSRILEHKPLAIVDGEDPLYQTGGFLSAFKDLVSSMPFMSMFTSSDLKYAYIDNSSFFGFKNYYKKGDIASSIRDDYRCEKGGWGSQVVGCDASGFGSSNRKVTLSDHFYIGYQGSCVSSATDVSNPLECLAYNDSGSTRYESCLEIERRSSISMNFFERMLAFFFGGALDWERSYEGLNCEIKKMEYKGWLFWGGWKDV